jgi:hypothetical protein
MFDLFDLSWGLRNADEHGADLEVVLIINSETVPTFQDGTVATTDATTLQFQSSGRPGLS